VVVGPWHLPITAAASRRVGLLDTLLGRAGAGSLPHPAGAASVILSVRLSISLASINLVSIEAALVMVDAASAIATSASGMDSGTASAVAGGADIRGGTQAITIPIGGGIPHLMIMTRTTSDS
jgi:hypothetical protein